MLNMQNGIVFSVLLWWCHWGHTQKQTAVQNRIICDLKSRCLWYSLILKYVTAMPSGWRYKKKIKKIYEKNKQAIAMCTFSLSFFFPPKFVLPELYCVIYVTIYMQNWLLQDISIMYLIKICWKGLFYLTIIFERTTGMDFYSMQELLLWIIY